MFVEPEDRDQFLSAADRTAFALEAVLRFMLWAVAGAIVAGAALIMVNMDAGSKAQGGRYYVAFGALVALGAVDNQFRWLARRRWPYLFVPAGYMFFSIRSLLLLLSAAVVLFALAHFLP